MGSGMDAPPKPPGRRKTDWEANGESGVANGLFPTRHSPFAIRPKHNIFPNVVPLIWSLLLSEKSTTFQEQLLMGINNENEKAVRAISTSKLHALLRFHTWPINEVVFLGSQGRNCFVVGFPLRCIQRLSRPHIATLRYRWRDNRYTGGAFIPVLS